MQGGLGITYFQDTAKDMQMENCSSKSIRTRPDPHPRQTPPAGRWKKKQKNITPPLGLGNAANGKNNKKTIKKSNIIMTFRLAITRFDCKRTGARSNTRHARRRLRRSPWLINVIAPRTPPFYAFVSQVQIWKR